MRTLKGSYTPMLLWGLASFLCTRTSLWQVPFISPNKG